MILKKIKIKTNKNGYCLGRTCFSQTRSRSRNRTKRKVILGKETKKNQDLGCCSNWNLRPTATLTDTGTILWTGFLLTRSTSFSFLYSFHVFVILPSNKTVGSSRQSELCRYSASSLYPDQVIYATPASMVCCSFPVPVKSRWLVSTIDIRDSLSWPLVFWQEKFSWWFERWKSGGEQ